jgi:hypothetical protein
MAIPNQLTYQGHVYVDHGEFPCPIEGGEDALIPTKDPEGNEAWWMDGHLFVYDEEQSTDDALRTAWARKV